MRTEETERRERETVLSLEKATVSFHLQQDIDSPVNREETERVCFHFSGIKEEHLIPSVRNKRLAAQKAQTMTKRGQFLVRVSRFGFVTWLFL